MVLIQLTYWELQYFNPKRISNVTSNTDIIQIDFFAMAVTYNILNACQRMVQCSDQRSMSSSATEE